MNCVLLKGTMVIDICRVLILYKYGGCIRMWITHQFQSTNFIPDVYPINNQLINNSLHRQLYFFLFTILKALKGRSSCLFCLNQNSSHHRVTNNHTYTLYRIQYHTIHYQDTLHLYSNLSSSDLLFMDTHLIVN